MSRRSIVYVDGFNFYYGSVRGTSYKWLNLQLLFQRLRQGDDIQAIYYFTALLDGRKGARQEVYLRALATLPNIHVVLGRFKTKQIRCRVPACTFSGSRFFDAPEEKRTDVNIALQMLNDVHHSRADQLVLVSGDSDLVPAVDSVKAESPRTRVIVYVPSRHLVRGAAVELRAAADKHRTFPQQLLKLCQFPAELSDGRGGVIRKPPEW